MSENLEDTNVYHYDKLSIEKIEKVMIEMSKEEKKTFNRKVQDTVKEKFPDYKEDVDELPVQVKALEVGESFEDRRINNFKNQGIDLEKPHDLVYFDGTRKHKSVWRAMRRGHTSVNGEEFPNRPFNNRKDKKINEIKKDIYGEYKKVASRE